jgi:hypothetical protein
VRAAEQVVKLLTAVATAAGVLLLAACGSAPDPLAPRHALTNADQRTAKLVDVQQADVPAAYRPHGSQKTGPRQCAPDLRDLTLTGVDLSKPFIAANGFGYVLGEVDVYRTPSQAEAAFKRITGTVRRRCLLQIAHSALAHYASGRVRIEPLSFAVNVIGGGLVGRRFAERWRDNGKTRIQNTDDVYVVIGRAFVVLSFWRYGAPFAAAAETRVIPAVATRALPVWKLAAKRTRPGGNTAHGE